MNEKIVEQLLEYMNVTKDFILSESPELIREIISYEKYLCIFSISIFLPLLVICISIFTYNWLYPSICNYGSISTKTFLRMLIPGFIAFISFGILMDACTGYIKIKTAPKYFIIQKIVNLKR
jgi:hypothetical protein